MKKPADPSFPLASRYHLELPLMISAVDWNSGELSHYSPDFLRRVLTARNPSLSALVAVEIVSKKVELEQQFISCRLPGGECPRLVDIMVSMELVNRRTPLLKKLIGPGSRQKHSEVEIVISDRTVIGVKAFTGYPGGGVGSRAAIDRLSLWKLLGMRRVVAVMGGARGGYVWARLGYRCSEDSIESVARYVHNRLRQPSVGKFLKPDQHDAVIATLRNRSPDLPFDIAMMAGRIGQVSTGNALLSGSRWLGEFDLSTDSICWRRASAYVGEL